MSRRAHILSAAACLLLLQAPALAAACDLAADSCSMVEMGHANACVTASTTLACCDADGTADALPTEQSRKAREDGAPALETDRPRIWEPGRSLESRHVRIDRAVDRAGPPLFRLHDSLLL